MRNAIYEEVPPKEKEDTEISHVLRAKCLTAFLKFDVVDIQRKVGCPEYFILKKYGSKEDYISSIVGLLVIIHKWKRIMCFFTRLTILVQTIYVMAQ